MVACRENKLQRRVVQAVAAAAAALVAASARADGVGGSVGLVSDKVQRGLSQTDGRAALLTDIGYSTDSGWSASVEWAVPYAASPLVRSLATVVLARGWQLGDNLGTQATYAHYAYVGAGPLRAYDYDEFGATIDLQGRWTAAATVSPNTAVVVGGVLLRGTVLSYEIGARQRLFGRWTVNGGLGYRDLRIARYGGGYGYGSIGVGNGIGPLQLDIVYIATSAGARQAASPGTPAKRWVASVLWPF